MAYSMDYRRAVARAYDGCGSSIEVAEQFGCSESWVRRLIQPRRERGTLEPGRSARRDDQRTYGDEDEREIREALAKPASLATVSRTLGRLDLPRKKSPRTPPSATGRT